MKDRESQIINKFFLPLAKNRESFGLSSDAALLSNNLVVSSDMMVEGTHFKKNHDPEKLAQKLLRINLSDLAAMGSKPYGYILNLAIPTSSDNWLKKFSNGLDKDSEKFKLKLFGGDISYSSKIFLGLTIFGKKINKLHTCAYANYNSDIFVSGNLGDAAVGYNILYDLKKIKCNVTDKKYFYDKFFLPEPKIDIGIKLLGKVDFCTDISDGIYSELYKISDKSNLEAVIYLDKIPLSSNLKRILEANNFRKMFNIILGGGEDYQLLFSAKGKKSENLQGTRIYHKIGYFRRGKGVKIMKNKSESYLEKIESYSHF